MVTYATNVHELKTGIAKEGDSRNSLNEIPDWYDSEKFKRGQDFFQRNVFGISLSMHWSLVAGFCMKNILEAVVFTNGTHTPKKALNRYIVTFYHVFMWLTGNIWDKNSKAYKSMKIVRGMHRNVAKQMNAAQTKQVYVSQYDMALVQSGFFGAALMHPREFGVLCTEEELDDYVYVWRVIGYCLGIDDQYNLCCGSLEETKHLVKSLEDNCLIPALENPPEDCDRMTDAYINGWNLNLYIPLHSKKSILSLVPVGEIATYQFQIDDWLRYLLLKVLTFCMCYLPGFKTLINSLTMYYFVQNIEVTMKKRLKREHDAYL